MKKLVMVSGWKNSGKDTCAEFLIEKYGFKRVAFADPLKDQVAEQFDIPRQWLDDRKLKEAPLLKYPANPKDQFSRMVLENMVKELRDSHGVMPHGFTYRNDEFYGLVRDTDGRELTVRVFHTPRSLAILVGSTNRCATPSYWVEKAVREMKKNENGLYVISDLRYKSEANLVKGLAGIENVVTIRVNRFESTESTDSSERDLDDYEFDHVLKNDGTILELTRKLEKALNLK